MAQTQFEQLVQVVKALRDPETGCPWDLKQDHKSLLTFLFEESFEFKEAVETMDYDHMQEEIGDVLLQVILHSQLASEKNKFDIEDVARGIKEKIVRRHPHVFDNPAGKKITEAQVKERWDDIKAHEKQDLDYKRAIKKKVLNAPSLTTAYEIGKKTQTLNFDWENAQQVAYKVEEFDKKVADFREKGCIPLGSPKTSIAFSGGRIMFFLSPIGIIVELIEEKNKP